MRFKFTLFWIVMLVVVINTVAPHDTPTLYTNWFWGWVHGIFVVPLFVLSFFVHDLDYIQSPNSGLWYNVWFTIGAFFAIVGFLSDLFGDNSTS